MGYEYAKKKKVKVIFVKPGQKILIIGKKHWKKKPHC